MFNRSEKIVAELKVFDEDIKFMMESTDMTPQEKSDYIKSKTQALLPICSEIIAACKKDFLHFFHESTKESIYLNEDLGYLLFFSIKYGHSPLLKILLEEAEKFTTQTEYRLDNYLASIKKREITGKAIKVNNAHEIEHFDKMGYTPKTGYLQEKGYDLKTENKYQKTMINSFFGLVNSVDEDGNNLLSVASMNRRDFAVKFLLEKGADINYMNGNYQTPIVVAIRCKNPHLARLMLLTQRSKIIPEYHLRGFFSITSLTEEDLSIFETLLDLVEDINKEVNPGLNWSKIGIEDFEYNIPLFQSAIEDFAHPKIIGLLLAKNPDLNQQYIHLRHYSHGYTALHLEVAKEDMTSLDIVKSLVEHGVDVNVKNIYGDTALHIMSMKEDIFSESKKVIKYLLEKGADPFIRNNKGLNVFEVAAKTGTYAIPISESSRIKEKYPVFGIGNIYLTVKTPGYAHYIPIWYRKAKSSVENNQIEEVLTETAMIQAPKNISGNKPKLDGGPGL